MEFRKLETKGVYEIFDKDTDGSHIELDNSSKQEAVGYINLKDEEFGVVSVDFKLVKGNSEDVGVKIVNHLFELGYEKIIGTAILNSHLFWKSVGAVVFNENQENPSNRHYFELTKEAFKRANNRD